MKWKIVIVDQF